MHTVEIDGCQVDLGAHWVGPTQRRVLALADEFGIEVEKQYLDGTHLLNLAGERRTYRGNIPLLSPLATLDTGVGMARAELRRLLVQREAPWRSRGAGRLDSYTLAHHMHGLRTDGARGMFTVIARTVFGAEPSELSYLYFLWYAQCAGGVMQLTDFKGGAQDAHLHGGHAADLRADRCESWATTSSSGRPRLRSGTTRRASRSRSGGVASRPRRRSSPCRPPLRRASSTSRAYRHARRSASGCPWART